MKVLVLGGTSESRSLAGALERSSEFETITSLAGRVQNPALPAGESRIGGFGGRDAMANWLRENGIGAVVDATHPFAENISAHAAHAAAQTGTPIVTFARRPWSQRAGDRWTHVATTDDAVSALEPGTRAFLTIGRQGLHRFADVDDVWFLVRAIDPPDGRRPPKMELLLERGPFDIDHEVDLLARHAIDVVVSKNSGGPMTSAKLDAARQLSLQVVMIDRPPPGASTKQLYQLDSVLSWLSGLVGGVPAGGENQ